MVETFWYPARGDVIHEHECPVCGVAVQHLFAPGRRRVYCTNACRQRAYRSRRAQGIRWFVERDGPAERSIRFKRHAVRDHRDPVAQLRDDRQRVTTVCGTFARTFRDMRVTHTNFVPELDFSCRTCAVLIGASPAPPPPPPGTPWQRPTIGASSTPPPAPPPLASATRWFPPTTEPSDGAT